MTTTPEAPGISEWLSLVREQTIADHKAAWERIESLGSEEEVLLYYRALLSSDYENRVAHLQSYAQHGSLRMKAAAVAALLEVGLC